MAFSDIFKLCTPALIYLVLSVLLLVVAIFSGMSALTLILKSALVVLWTFLLNWLCSRGLGVLAWIVLALPVLLIVLLASMSSDVQAAVSTQRPEMLVLTPTSTGSGGCSSCGAH
jgi:hypothetical protein